MILKKPYSFLIKHFRLLNLFLFGCLLFISLQVSSIYRLFSSLQKSNTYIYALADTYINYFIYLFAFAGILLSGIVIFLFYKKKKPIKTYSFIFVYFIAIIIYCIYTFSNLNKLVDTILELDNIIILKDVSSFAYFLSFPLLFITFIRGIGFNLKQFNFKKDVEELKTDENDNAEFEVVLGQNNYKYARTIRRFFRELKYYFIENKFSFIFIIVLLFFISGIFGFNYYKKYKNKITQTEIASANGLSYKINYTFLTSKDSIGNIVKDGYKYIIINMTVINNTVNNKTIDLETISLYNDDLSYYPDLTKNELFYDLGVSYKKDGVIKSNSQDTFTLCFELANNTKINSPTLRIMYGLENKTTKILGLYRLFNLNVINLDEDYSTVSIDINDMLTFNESNINKLDFIINNYSIKDLFSYNYLKCDSSLNCNYITNVIKSSHQNEKIIIELDCNYNLYNDSLMNEYYTNISKIINNFGKIKYNYNGSEITSDVNVLDNYSNNNKLYLEVNRSIYTSNNIRFVFKFRNHDYIINLN